MNACFLQNTFIGEKDQYLAYLCTAFFRIEFVRFATQHLSMWTVLNMHLLTEPKNSHCSNSKCFTSLETVFYNATLFNLFLCVK